MSASKGSRERLLQQFASIRATLDEDVPEGARNVEFRGSYNEDFGDDENQSEEYDPFQCNEDEEEEGLWFDDEDGVEDSVSGLTIEEENHLASEGQNLTRVSEIMSQTSNITSNINEQTSRLIRSVEGLSTVEDLYAESGDILENEENKSEKKNLKDIPVLKDMTSVKSWIIKGRKIPPAHLEQALQLNRMYQDYIRDELKKITICLNRIDRRKTKAECAINETKTETKQPNVLMFSMPYFRDSVGVGPPDNEDIKLRKEHGHISPYLAASKLWTEQDRQLLAQGVRDQNMQKLVEHLVNEIRDIELHGHKEKDRAATQRRLDKLKHELESIKKEHEGSKELLNSLDGLDFVRIAAVYLPNRTPYELRLQWVNIDHPLINNDKWSKKEDEALLKLSKVHNRKSWALIAEKMGTCRTPVQCLQRFQRTLNNDLLKREWTEEEDQRLIKAVQECHPISWQAVADVVGGRTGAQCCSRYRLSVAPGYKKGRWSEEEDKLLLKGIKAHGKKWIKIQTFIPWRSEASIRERFVNVYDPSLVFTRFTKKEDKLLLQLVSEFGKGRWSKIASKMPGRTDSMVAKRYKNLRPEEYLDYQKSVIWKRKETGAMFGRRRREKYTYDLAELNVPTSGEPRKARKRRFHTRQLCKKVEVEEGTFDKILKDPGSDILLRSTLGKGKKVSYTDGRNSDSGEDYSEEEEDESGSEDYESGSEEDSESDWYEEEYPRSLKEQRELENEGKNPGTPCSTEPSGTQTEAIALLRSADSGTVRPLLNMEKHGEFSLPNQELTKDPLIQTAQHLLQMYTYRTAGYSYEEVKREVESIHITIHKGGDCELKAAKLEAVAAVLNRLEEMHSARKPRSTKRRLENGGTDNSKGINGTPSSSHAGGHLFGKPKRRRRLSEEFDPANFRIKQEDLEDLPPRELHRRRKPVNYAAETMNSDDDDEGSEEGSLRGASRISKRSGAKQVGASSLQNPGVTSNPGTSTLTNSATTRHPSVVTSTSYTRQPTAPDLPREANRITIPPPNAGCTSTHNAQMNGAQAETQTSGSKVAEMPGNLGPFTLLLQALHVNIAGVMQKMARDQALQQQAVASTSQVKAKPSSAQAGPGNSETCSSSTTVVSSLTPEVPVITAIPKPRDAFPRVLPLTPNTTTLTGLKRLLAEKRKLKELAANHVCQSHHTHAYRHSYAYKALAARFDSLFIWPIFLALHKPCYTPRRKKRLGRYTKFLQSLPAETLQNRPYTHRKEKRRFLNDENGSTNSSIETSNTNHCDDVDVSISVEPEKAK